MDKIILESTGPNMFQPKIVKVCPVEEGKGIYIEWTIPKKKRTPPVVGYTIAYRRCDLDINFSTRCVVGGSTSNIVVSPSKASSVYEIKVAAFSDKEHGNYCQPVTWSLEGEWMKTKERTFLAKNENLIPVYNRTPRDENFPKELPKECYLCAYTNKYLAYIKFLRGLTKGKLDAGWMENLSLRKLYKEEIQSPLADLIPVPRVTKLVSVDKGQGILIQWEIPNDVSSVMIEGFLIAYRQCDLGSTNMVKLVPGSDVSLHVLSGLKTCTLYELKIAAYIGEGKGRYCIPMIIRTGVQLPATTMIQKSTEPRYIPKIVRMYPINEPAGIFVKWTPPTQYFGPTITGYVIAYREAKSPDKSFQTCYIRGINSSSHVIKGVRKGVDYEVKLATYNPSGDGPFSLKRLIRNSGPMISSSHLVQILKKNKIKLPT